MGDSAGVERPSDSGRYARLSESDLDLLLERVAILVRGFGTAGRLLRPLQQKVTYVNITATGQLVVKSNSQRVYLLIANPGGGAVTVFPDSQIVSGEGIPLGTDPDWFSVKEPDDKGIAKLEWYAAVPAPTRLSVLEVWET